LLPLFSKHLLQPEIHQCLHLHTPSPGLLFKGCKQFHFNRHSTGDLKLHIGGGRIVKIGEVVSISKLTDLLVGICPGNAAKPLCAHKTNPRPTQQNLTRLTTGDQMLRPEFLFNVFRAYNKINSHNR